jgi:putative transcriptional regulator
LTQEDLAKKVGVTRKTINTIENGVFTPSAYLALKIAKAFGEPVENIFYIE